MPESEETETTDTPEVEAEEQEETRDFEAMLADSQDNLARARAVIAHYGGADLDVDTELRFVVPNADGELMYRPVAAAPEPEESVKPIKATVRPRRATPTRQAPKPKTIDDMNEDEFSAYLRNPENRMVKVDS